MLDIEPPIEPKEEQENLIEDYRELADFEYHNHKEQAMIEEYEAILDYVKDMVFVITETIETNLSYKNTRYIEDKVVLCSNDFNTISKFLFDKQHKRTIYTLQVWECGKRLIYYCLDKSKKYYTYEGIQKEIVQGLKNIKNERNG